MLETGLFYELEWIQARKIGIGYCLRAAEGDMWKLEDKIVLVWVSG